MKNKKKWAKFTALVLSATCFSVNAMQCVNNIYASAVEVEDSSLHQYAEDMLVDYLDNSEYSSLEGVSLSSAFDYYNFETMSVCGTVYVVYHNDDVIGMLCIGDDAGEYSSSYLDYEFPKIQKALDNNIDIALGCYNQRVVCYDGEAFVDLQTNQDIEVNANSASVDIDSVSPCYTDLQDCVSPIATYATPYMISLKIDSVPNEVVNDKGICWAASIAAKYNYVHKYKKGDTGYVTARNVYDIVGIKLGGTPVGSVEYTRAALDCYGLTNTYKAYALSGTAVYGELYQKNPVIISISTSSTSKVQAAHSVVISGIILNAGTTSSTVQYQLCDSNFEEIKTTTLKKESPYDESIEYFDAAYGCTFTNWYQSYSYKWG